MGVFDVKEAIQVDIGVSKSFFRKTLVFSCTVEDILHISKDIITINFQGQDVYLRSYHETQKIWLRLRYIFGQSQQKRKSGYQSAAEELQNRANTK